jgi:hypothetical protein
VRARFLLAAVAPLATLATFVIAPACSQKQDHYAPVPSGGGTYFDPDAFERFPDGGQDTRDREIGEGGETDGAGGDGDATAEGADGETMDSDSSPADGDTATNDGDTAPEASGDTPTDGDVASLDVDVGDVGDGDGVDGDGHVVRTDECFPPLTTSTLATCGVTVQSWKIQSAPDGGFVDHVGFDTTVLYCTTPPSSGPHYPVWAAFRSYSSPVPHENLVHDLEHGAVIVLYKCPDATSGSCASTAAALQAIIDARPIDPECDSDAGVKRRVILSPDPTLDVAVGAAAWGWTYRATCVDATSLGAFIDVHYGAGPEDFCTDGCPGPFPTCT